MYKLLIYKYKIVLGVFWFYEIFKSLAMSQIPRVKSKIKVLNCRSSVFHIRDKACEESELSTGLIKTAKLTGQLNLSNRGLGAVPDNVWKIDEIVIDDHKNIDFNRSDSDNWWNSVALKSLDLSSNAIREISPNVKLLGELISLHLQDNAIEQLPQELGELHKLETLNISHNKIRCLPNEFYKLCELKLLTISHNILEKLEPEFGDLVMLKKLEVSAVSPKELLKNSVVYNKQTEQLKIKNDVYDLRGLKVFVVGAGKAVMHMAQQVEIVLGSKIESGIISVPCGSVSINAEKSMLQSYEGAADNLPDAAAKETAQKIMDLAKCLDDRCFLLVLISGGGSALLPLPRNPVTLDDKLNLIKKLANSGADIKELNSVRKQLSDIKGGRLSAAAQPAQVVSLILSDIVGDPLDLIASGPTVYNTDSSSRARDIIQKYISLSDLPTSINSLLKYCQSQQTITLNVDVDNAHNYILGNNQMALQSAMFESNKLGCNCLVLSSEVMGNVSEIAKDYITLVETINQVISGSINESEAEDQIKSLNNVPIKITNIRSVIALSKSIYTKHICLIFGGEPTVKVEVNGKGGRSQQLALEFSFLLSACHTFLNKLDVSILCAGTDGIDGPTDAAGAIGYLSLVNDAEQQQFNIHEFIKNNDSHNFYSQFCDGQFHVKTGHTYTNVIDDLSYNELIILPSGMGYLVRLVDLNLSYNHLTELPPDIVNLRELKKLDVSHNKLNFLPALGELRRMELMYGDHNDLKEMPDFYGCTALKELYMGNNNIKEISEEFCDQMQQLHILNLRDNKLEFLPENVVLLKKLKRFDLTNNYLNKLPVNLGLLSQLENLHMDGNKFTSLRQDVVRGGTNRLLRFLRDRTTDTATNMDDHPEIDWPDKYAMRKVQALLVCGCGLTSLPERLFDDAAETQVTCVDLTNNKLSAVPLGIIKVSESLTQLTMSSNNLTSVPADLASCVRLQFIDLSKNQITDLPLEFGQLINMREIILSNNKLPKIPICVYKMEKLEILLLAENCVAEIDVSSDALAKLTRLAVLDLRNNSISSVPPQLGNFTQLRSLELMGNLFRQPRYAVLQKGTDSILCYLRDRIPK